MEIFRKKSRITHRITLKSTDQVLYEGPVSEIPLTEEAILSASIRYFNDPEPCEIHRSAARLRIAADLTASLLQGEKDLAQIRALTGLSELTDAVWTKTA